MNITNDKREPLLKMDDKREPLFNHKSLNKIPIMKKNINISATSDLQTLTVGRGDSITAEVDHSYQPPEDDYELLQLVKSFLAFYMNNAIDHPEELVEIIIKTRDEEMKALKEENKKLKDDLNFFIGQIHDLRQSFYDLKKQIDENK